MELKATMLNINKGHNKKLMDACRTLDYAEYTALVREYAQLMPLAEAVERRWTTASAGVCWRSFEEKSCGRRSR